MKLIYIFFILWPTLLCAQIDSTLKSPPDFYEIAWDDDYSEMLDYIRVDYFQENINYVVMGKTSDSILNKCGFDVPSRFVHKIKLDTVSRDWNRYPYTMDSAIVIDYPAIDSFYRYNDSIQIDTIWVSDEKKYHMGDFDYYTIREVCQYKDKIKHGVDRQYYSLSEMRGLTVRGPHFHLKLEGHWKHGYKNGKWFYYTPSGELSRRETWRNGKLIRTKYVH